MRTGILVSFIHFHIPVPRILPSTKKSLKNICWMKSDRENYSTYNHHLFSRTYQFFLYNFILRWNIEFDELKKKSMGFLIGLMLNKQIDNFTALNTFQVRISYFSIFLRLILCSSVQFNDFLHKGPTYFILWIFLMILWLF